MSLRDRAIGILLLLIMVPTCAVSTLFRKLRGKTHSPFKFELLLALSRRTYLLPISFKRRLRQRDQISRVRQSKRFSKSATTLCEEVSRADFTGYWVCKGSVGSAPPPSQPSKSDVTIIWIHGGGYSSSDALDCVSQNLRIAELVTARGHSINIFALQYNLAPETCFPEQVNQAAAAYRYLVEEVGIDPAAIVIMGESAGGHLALSLLYDIAQKGGQPTGCPGMAMLMYPWVNLENSGASFRDNRDKDFLSKRDLDRCANWVLGKEGRDKFAHLVNFNASLPKGFGWGQVLPPRTWVTVGGHDLFLADVEEFVDKARGGGAEVEFHVEEGMPHGWLGYHDVMASKRYFGTALSEDVSSMMPGAEVLAKVVCDYVSATR
ncbi:hypothetical protein FQN50_005181 [Emmonsiellopsis sp. PD_5]|nr:hypothetical protein FQN50_005181 [Emmonsiellopsis sp. PD_5]